MASLGNFSVIPWIVAFVMQNSSGWFADGLHKRGHAHGDRAQADAGERLYYRRPAAVVLADTRDRQQWQWRSSRSRSAARRSAGAVSSVNHLDVAPRYAGILMGISNTSATVPGIIGVAATGFILQATNSFSAVFYLTTIVYAVGAICYIAMASGDRKI